MLVLAPTVLRLLVVPLPVPLRLLRLLLPGALVGLVGLLELLLPEALVGIPLPGMLVVVP